MRCICGATHGCACKTKIASDGSKRCSSCIMSYEASINKKGTPIVVQPRSQHVGTAPSINNITYTQGR